MQKVKVQKLANILFGVGIVLALLQVLSISILDNYGKQLAVIDTSISKLSSSLVSLDNYILLYKSPELLKDVKAEVHDSTILFINPNLDREVLSYELNNK